MEKKFTPGPWRVKGDNDFGYFVQADRLKPEHPYDIEILGDDHHEELYPESVYRADCALVSASPELLEACESVRADMVARMMGDDTTDCCSPEETIAYLDVAIKKAYWVKP